MISIDICLIIDANILFQTDNGGLLGESPYIGRARYKPNRLAGESEILSQPGSIAQLHSLPGPHRAEVKMDMNVKLDREIAMKQDRVAKGESRNLCKEIFRGYCEFFIGFFI